MRKYVYVPQNKGMKYVNLFKIANDMNQNHITIQTDCQPQNKWIIMSDNLNYIVFLGSPTLPSFTVTPSDQSVPLGGNVTFTCQAEGNPTPTVMWLHVSSLQLN